MASALLFGMETNIFLIYSYLIIYVFNSNTWYTNIDLSTYRQLIGKLRQIISFFNLKIQTEEVSATINITFCCSGISLT